MTQQQPSLDDPGPTHDLWRNEVQWRLECYKRRRGRRIEGAFTMRFPFPLEEPAVVVSSPVLEQQAVEQAVLPAVLDQPMDPAMAEPQSEPPEGISDGTEKDTPLGEKADAPDAEVTPTGAVRAVVPETETGEEASTLLIELPPRPKPRRKVIAFPTPAYAPVETARRLADPVQPEQLRILDVPEELQAIPATPFLEGLLDAPAPLVHSLRADTVELPCAPAHVGRRLGAALIDLVIALGGVGVCAAIASRFLTELPPMKFLLAGTGAVSVMLWASYQYLFLVYGGRTLGMRAARVRLQTFKGHPLNFRQRRLRVVGLYLSVLSLGMGVLWSFVDADSLCWHDRISQTFPATADRS